mgnify:CR=1 FL=1
MNRLLDPVTRFFATVTSNPISLAGSALTTLPTLLLFLPLQSRMTSGLAAGSVKQ